MCLFACVFLCDLLYVFVLCAYIFCACFRGCVLAYLCSSVSVFVCLCLCDGVYLCVCMCVFFVCGFLWG